MRLITAMWLLCALSAGGGNPHVLFIAVDDLRPELGCYGAERIKTPRIDRLADEGLRFERAYCQMAICMASRASLMSGHYATRGNRMYQRGAMFEYLPDVLSLNQHFLNNGYETITIGKVYHHKSDDETGWTRAFGSLDGPWGMRGYVEEASLQLQETGRRNNHRGPAYENAEVDDAGYETAALADKAIEELRNIGDKPLFVALGFRKPHLPFNAPRKYWELYDHDAIRLSAFPEPPKDSAKEGYTNWGELRSYHGIPKKGPLSAEVSLNLIHAYYACVSYVDAQLGRVLDELDRLGLKEDTIVVLWADHGWKLGDYGMWCKHTEYEIDARVPLLVRAPGMKEKGKRTEALVELVDLYPTLCDLAGIEKPPHLQGRSFAPLLDDADQPWKEAAFTVWSGRRDYAKSGPFGYSMRHGNYRYTEWRDTKTDAVLAKELYDHSRGPLASANEIDLPGHRALVEKLSGMLDAWRQAYDGDDGDE
jgi:iduronate 2-sulfatase